MLQRYSSVASLAKEWDALADATHAQPWARPGWIESWWRAFGSGELEIWCLRRDGQLRAVLPLQRVLGALASTTNWHTPEFDAVGDPDSIAELLSAVLAARPRRLSLAFVDLAAQGPRALCMVAGQNRQRMIVRPLERSPFIRSDEDWDAYLRGRDGKMLRDLRRRRRRLESDHELTFEVLCGDRRLDELLEEGFRVEAAAWKGARGTAIASQPATRRFYEDVARWCASRGSLRLAFLRHGSTPIAFDFAVEDQGVHYLLKTGFDPEARRFAPGKLLRYAMIERAFQLGLHSYEFLGADNPWKLEWTDTLRDRSLMQVFAPSLSGHADWAAYAYGRPFVKRVLAMAGHQ
jgi:CelD/BcsL family acetyltransferase involved in cellulose biosynthesis